MRFRFRHRHASTADQASYRLVFPTRVETKQVQAWLHLTSGGLSLGRHGSLAIETWGDERGIGHRLRVPERQAEGIIAQLRANLPGIHVSPDVCPSHPQWQVVAELRQANPRRALAIPSPEVVSAGLLACMQLKHGERLLLQCVVSPVMPRPPAPPKRRHRRRMAAAVLSGLVDAEPVGRNDLRDPRSRWSEPRVRGVLRIAAQASSPAHAAALVTRLRGVLAGIASPGNRWRDTWSLDRGRRRRLAQGSGSVLSPGLTPISELSGLLAWPLGSPHVAGLPQSRSRHLPPPASIRNTDGAVFATANFPGAERPLAISMDEATQHALIIGPTGAGKTTILNQLACQWAELGAGIVCLESKGDLYHALLNSLPASRKDEVIVLEVGDSRPLGFNVLSHGNARSAIDELSSLITNIYGDSGIYTPMLLYHGLHALAETSGCTFIDLPAMLTPQSPEEAAWRESVVDNLQNKEIRLFWQRYLNGDRKEQDRISAPVHNRIWQFTVRPEVRSILGTSRSSFTFEDVVCHNRIVLIHLNGVRVGSRTASIMGALLISSLYSAVRTTSGKYPTILFCDEFQDFLTHLGSDDTADMLAKARSSRLAMVLSHQHLGQLSPDLRNSVLINARSKIVFSTTAQDAHTFAREFGRQVDDSDFLNLGPYEVIARIATRHGVSPPVTGVTLPPRQPTGLAEEIRKASRQRYGRSIEEIEAEIAGRRQVQQPDKRKRPKLGEQEA